MAADKEAEDPRTWTLDFLPLLRQTAGPWPELGLLLPGGGPVVYLTGVFEPALSARLKTCERLTYPSYRALTDDGWVID